VQVVVDHLSGVRRGERQVLDASPRVLFGRHPDAAVEFGAEDDLDASVRHAELRAFAGGWVLVDLGSSNGTFVNGLRVSESAVTPGQAMTVQFGPAGPRVRVVLVPAEAVAGLPPLVLPKPARPRWWWPLVAVIAAAVVGVAIVVLGG